MPPTGSAQAKTCRSDVPAARERGPARCSRNYRRRTDRVLGYSESSAFSRLNSSPPRRVPRVFRPANCYPGESVASHLGQKHAVLSKLMTVSPRRLRWARLCSHDHFFLSHLELASKAARQLVDVLHDVSGIGRLHVLGLVSRTNPVRHD